MKRLKMKLLVAMAAIMFCGCAAGLHDTAGDLRTPMAEGQYIAYTEYMTLSADASGVLLDPRLAGGYLTQVEIYSSADDAMTFSIDSHLGTELFTITTTAATGGEIATPTAFWWIPKATSPTYTLSGLGSGTVTIEITVVKK